MAALESDKNVVYTQATMRQFGSVFADKLLKNLLLYRGQERLARFMEGSNDK